MTTMGCAHNSPPASVSLRRGAPQNCSQSRRCEVRVPEYQTSMHLVLSRYLALLFAVGLAIGETIVSWGHWQFAPLWIIDYLTSVCLLYAYYKTSKAENLHTLLAAWPFAAGVFYMDLFVNLDPNLPASMRPGPIVMWLIVLLLVSSLVGFLTALSAFRAQRIHPSATTSV